MAFIDTFAKYHTLSKYPVDENTSLANVRNKSGHTVTTSDIWASEIPAFFVVYDDDTRNSLAAKEGDLCTQGSQLYEYKDGAWATRNALVDGEVIGGVIKYHKGCKAVILTDTNNSGTGGNGFSVRIRPNAAASTDPFIESFISSMDKVVNGIPSMGYNPVVHDTTSATGFRDEGTGTNDFIANCYGGVITFNTKRNDAESKITIDCFEYVGSKLNTTLSNIDAKFEEVKEDIQDIVGVTMEGVVASVGTDAAATSAGLSVDSTVKTSPKITFTEGEVKAGETKLVSGGAVATVTNALSDRIAQLEGITHFEVKPVDALPAEADLEANTIYLVKDAASTVGDCYEYVAYFDSTQNKVVAEQIGTTTVDLAGYTTDAEHTALADRVTALDAATTGRVAVVEGKVTTLETVTVPALEQAISDAKDAAIDGAKVILTQGTGIIVSNSGTAQHEFTISVSDAVATSADLQALTTRVSALEDTTIPAIQQSVTELTKTVGDNKTAIEKALADAKTEIGTTTSGLDTRLQTAEGKVSTLEGQVKALTEGDTSVDSKIAAAKTEIKATTDAIAATANTAVQSASGDTYVSAEKEAGTTNIKVTTNITAIDAELVKTTSDVGAAIKAASDAAGKAASDADAALTAAKAEIKATTDGLAQAITKAQGDAVTAANSYTDGQISAAKTEIKGTTDAIAADVETLKQAMGETEDGTSIIDAITEIKSTLATTTATANTAAQSAEGDTYVSASQSGTKITVETNIANITSHVDTELVKSGTAVATAIQGAAKAGTDAAAEALAAAQAAQQTAEARISSVTEGTNSNLLTVDTNGTAVTITLDGDVATKTNISETALNGSGESSDKFVKVTLGGTLGNQSVTVETDDIASAAALQALSDRVTGLHQTPQFSVVVVAGVTNLENWKDAVDGGVKKNTIYLVENTEAADGSYIEFIAYESGETVVTERIGTTKTDLADYAKTSEVTQAISDAIGALDATNVGEGAVKVSQTDGKVTSVTVATEALVSDDAIKASVTDANALVTAADALEAIKLAKPENYVASVTGYTTQGTEVTTTQGAAVKVLDGRGTSVTANDLWGSKVTVDSDGVVTITDEFIDRPATMPETVTSVYGDAVYVNDQLYANIQLDKIRGGDMLFSGCANLTTISGQFRSLEIGSSMFAGTGITQFGPARNLVRANNMFAGCSELITVGIMDSIRSARGMFYDCKKLQNVIQKFPMLTNGEQMFYNTKLAAWDADLPELVNGEQMFCADAGFGGSTSTAYLTSFTGDMPKLQRADHMFNGQTQLTSFAGDLSSLQSASGMFQDCKLDTESLMIIADTIADAPCSDAEINIGIGNTTPSEEEIEYLNEMHEKGWNVYVNGSEYTPDAASAAMTLDENGEEVTTPIPFWAKPIEVKEEEAEYVAENGKYYIVVGGQFIFVDDPETYGMFTCMEDAIANMRLTPYVREEQA